jgi:hypothetical protein
MPNERKVTKNQPETSQQDEHAMTAAVLAVTPEERLEILTARWLANLLAGKLVAAERAGAPLGNTPGVAWDKSVTGQWVGTPPGADHPILELADGEEGKKQGDQRIRVLAGDWQPVCCWRSSQTAVGKWSPQKFDFDLAALLGLEEAADSRALAAGGIPRRTVASKVPLKLGFVAQPLFDGPGRRLRLQIIGEESFAGPAVAEIRLVSGEEDATDGRASDLEAAPVVRFAIELSRSARLEGSPELDLVRQKLCEPSVGGEVELVLPDRLPPLPRAQLLVRPQTMHEALLVDPDAEVHLLRETAPQVYSVDRQKCRLGLGQTRLVVERGFLFTFTEFQEQFAKVYRMLAGPARQLAECIPDDEVVAKALESMQKSLRGGVDSPYWNENPERSPDILPYFYRAVSKQNIQSFWDMQGGRTKREAEEDDERAAVQTQQPRLVRPEGDFAVVDDKMLLELLVREHGAQLLRKIVALLPEMTDNVEHLTAWLLRYFGWREYDEVVVKMNSPLETWWQRLMPYQEVARRLGDEEAEEKLRQAVCRINDRIANRLLELGWLDEQKRW